MDRVWLLVGHQHRIYHTSMEDARCTKGQESLLRGFATSRERRWKNGFLFLFRTSGWQTSWTHGVGVRGVLYHVCARFCSGLVMSCRYSFGDTNSWKKGIALNSLNWFHS